MSVSRSTSSSLDIVRAVAAVVVALYHGAWLGLDGGLLFFLTPEVGHAAVIVFFVLSGFVIANSTRPDQSLLEYVIKRASRVYSVALPALVLAAALGYLLLWFGLTPGNAYELRKPFLYLAFHLCFGGDLWGFGIGAFSIEPYWSLDYEVWYYAIFGAAVLARGFVRSIAVAVICIVAGPKILLLLPVWLSGVGVHAVSRQGPLPRPLARYGALAALLLLLGFNGSAWDHAISSAGSAAVGPHLPFPLRFSQWFLADYVRCVLTAAMIWSLCSAEIRWPDWLARAGSKAAGVSFSLYLVHYPLMQFLKAALPGFGPLNVLLAIAISIVFGMVFEPQRAAVQNLLRATVRRPLRLVS